ncbi:MAG: hypothetical protein ABJF23_07935 [Bryobacteraceae bacterium]
MSEPWNYFNYFTEIEEHFQRARGTGLFLLSPLDWALIETWKDAGVPLEAVLRGIDSAFVKWHSKKKKLHAVNSLAYCAQAVFTEAQIMAGAAPAREPKATEAPFSLESLVEFLRGNAGELGKRDAFLEIADSLNRLADEAPAHYLNLEELEQRLSALEDRMKAMARLGQSEQQMFEARRELDSTLRPYRSKMTADQLAVLERQYLERILLEKANLPRLSLFYL